MNRSYIIGINQGGFALEILKLSLYYPEMKVIKTHKS